MTVKEFKKLLECARDDAIIRLIDRSEDYRKEYDIPSEDVETWADLGVPGVKYFNIVIPYKDEKSRTIARMSYAGRQLLGIEGP